MTGYQGWKRDNARLFGVPIESAERFQRPWPAEAPYDLVETSYFGFSIPEERINCEIYHWTHPKFGLTSGGVFIFQGINASKATAEYINYKNYLPAPDDIVDVTYQSGISVKMLKPSEEFEIEFDDPENETSFRFTSKAIMPAAFRPTGGHITQAMKNTGTLTLRGKTYPIDSYFCRDRSWGDPRRETLMKIPPVSWLVGVFKDEFAFHVMAYDSPELDPWLVDHYPNLVGGNNFIWGYVWKEGRLLGVTECRKVTVWHEDGITPLQVRVSFTDEEGAGYEIEGAVTACIPFDPFPNVICTWALTEWTYAGLSGHGDTQSAFYQDYLQKRLIGGKIENARLHRLDNASAVEADIERLVGGEENHG